MFSLMLLAVIYLAFISLGLPDSMLGAAWPMMYQELGVPVSSAGIISAVVCVGTTVSSLLYAKASSKMSTWSITAVSVALTASALLAYSQIHSFPVFIAAALVLGIGAGAVDAGLNNYVALHYKARAMNFLHAIWGVGTLVGPFLLSYFFAHGFSWRYGYITIGSLQAAICIIILLSRNLWRKAGESTITSSGEKPEIKENASLSAALKQPGAKAAMLGFFSYCAFEQTSMLWVSTYLVSSKGFSEGSAAAAAGLLFWGITTGRIVSGLLADRVGAKHMITAAQISIAIGTVLVAIVPGGGVAAGAALFFLGMGFGPIYPMMLHQTPEYFGAEYSSRIIGLEMASAYVGVALLPALFGVIGRSISMSVYPIYVLILLALNVAATETKKRVCRRGM